MMVVFHLNRGLGYTGMCICENSANDVLILWNIHVDFDLSLMICMLKYLEGSILICVIWLEVHEKNKMN